MAETTGSPQVGALALLFTATILSQASTLHAQVSETAADRPENTEQAGAEVEGVPAQADPGTGFPTGYWIEFGDGKDWLRLTSGGSEATSTGCATETSSSTATRRTS